MVELGLNFNVVEDGFVQPQPISFKGDFYGAETELDAILSYPWLHENSVGVFHIEMRVHGTGLILGFYTPGKKTCQRKVLRPWKSGAGGGRYALFWPYALGGSPP